MQSGSPTTSPSGESAHRFANLVGSAIALVTLVLPLITIAYYTPNVTPSLPPPAVKLGAKR
ncbi:hypothetical protein [Myxacorys almedinensis]|uniref:Uncharacterized protein n=1 Tax=Myxacorys almedinensis A TaxID=2690445 RepID=A0A8J7Z5N4_9CYAN|nr:hypothetical protein [Myxacorys almedinensis]NDJ18616.1 hypothetical protein [Myxacorys almedinensis A]